jgi:hypothetical protein
MKEQYHVRRPKTGSKRSLLVLISTAIRIGDSSGGIPDKIHLLAAFPKPS